MLFPESNDWDKFFRPAVLALLNGTDVYSVAGFYNVSWTLFPLIPFAVLPPELGHLLLLFCSSAAFIFIAWRFGAHPISAGAFVRSPFVFVSLA